MHKKSYKIFLLLLIFTFTQNFFLRVQAHWVRSRIIITEGGTVSERSLVSEILTIVIQEINRETAGVGNLDRIKRYCSEDGFLSIRELVRNDSIYSISPIHRTNLIELNIFNSRYFEVRNIQVNVDRLSFASKIITKTLVFTLNNRGIIVDVNYAIEQNEYKKILQLGQNVTDETQREQIIKFLEKFQTAYNKKDLSYLKMVFSDRALIIVGHVVRESKQRGDFIEENSFLNQGQVRLIRMSKQQYLERLQTKVFDRNSWINVKYSDIKIIQHSSIQNIYGVALFQQYDSQYYCDRGHLFLMFDFQNVKYPIIHVRCWQEKPFDDGSYIDLYNFRLAPRPE